MAMNQKVFPRNRAENVSLFIKAAKMKHIKKYSQWYTWQETKHMRTIIYK